MAVSLPSTEAVPHRRGNTCLGGEGNHRQNPTRLGTRYRPTCAQRQALLRSDTAGYGTLSFSTAEFMRHCSGVAELARARGCPQSPSGTRPDVRRLAMVQTSRIPFSGPRLKVKSRTYQARPTAYPEHWCRYALCASVRGVSAASFRRRRGTSWRSTER